MRTRTLALAGLAALLVLPAAANGGAHRTDTQAATAQAAAAQGGNGMTVRFTLKRRGNEAVAIKRFRFRGLRALCDGGTVVRVHGRIPYMKVNRRNKFSRTLRKSGKVVRVKGRVSSNLRVVKGTIIARGAYGGQTGCNSGKVRWRAR